MADQPDRLYGKWAITDHDLPLLNADHILGARIVHDGKGRPDFVEIQYRSSDAEPIQVIRMDYLNALALLSMLKSMQLDEKTPFPDDPRGY